MMHKATTKLLERIIHSSPSAQNRGPTHHILPAPTREQNKNRNGTDAGRGMMATTYQEIRVGAMLRLGVLEQQPGMSAAANSSFAALATRGGRAHAEHSHPFEVHKVFIQNLPARHKDIIWL
jgi:hypothetical protein